MADSLTAVNAVLAGVHPSLDVNGGITQLTIDIALAYVDGAGQPAAGRTVSFDAWQVLSDAQKANMQDIQNTIQTHIAGTYFG
jgi:hypothetical protein